MTSDEAGKLVDDLYQKMYARWSERVMEHAFMRELQKGTLPMSAIREYFRNWGMLTVEVNALNAATYYKHLPFFLRHFDLLGPFCDKIADELIHPRPPGHVLVMLKTAEKLGLTREQIFQQPMRPEARGMIDFYRKVFLEGSIAEVWAAHVYEESIGHFAQAWFKDLTAHYGFSAGDATYYSTHAEADLEEHEGVMGHGQFNRLVFQRILMTGEFGDGCGYPLEYCATAPADLHALMLRAALESA
jgi:pyrroloquinoline quinone (PQQ) biosynthesis protein C